MKLNDLNLAMDNLVDIIFALLTVLLFLVAFWFLLRTLQAKSHTGRALYGVGRQHRRSRMLLNLMWTMLFLACGLLTGLAYGVRSSGLTTAFFQNAVSPTPTNLPTPSPLPATTIPPTIISLPPTVAANLTTTLPASPTPPPQIPSRTPEPSPTVTTTSEPPTAIVNSANGLYLREAPGGVQQVELIADGAELILLAGRQNADDLEWQQVQTNAGNIGWVALDFIILPEE